MAKPSRLWFTTAHGEKHHKETPIANHDEAMGQILSALTSGATKVIDRFSEIEAVGHRVVHGGEEFTGSVLIDDDGDRVDRKLRRPGAAPQPAQSDRHPGGPERLAWTRRKSPVSIRPFTRRFPQVAYMYALPYELYEKYGIRRYGFHGTSHRWVARRTAKLFGRHKYDINCVTCHLGNGCSIAAVKDGRSVDTSMGMTPLEGVVMGTRSGGFDPAILFYLTEKGYDIKTLKKMCNKKSGLLGISGISNDMRTLVEKAQEDDDRAALAIDVFCYRIKMYIGAYAAALGRVDAVCFHRWHWRELDLCP